MLTQNPYCLAAKVNGIFSSDAGTGVGGFLQAMQYSQSNMSESGLISRETSPCEAMFRRAYCAADRGQSCS
jgi:hypothetical protein